MVVAKILKTTEDIKQCFNTFHNTLSEAHHEIIVGIETAKRDTEVVRVLARLLFNSFLVFFQEYLGKINSELQTITRDIETLAEEDLNGWRLCLLNSLILREKLTTYEVIKETEMQMSTPECTLKFQCVHTSTANAAELPPSEPSDAQNNTRRKSCHRNKFHPYKKMKYQLVFTQNIDRLI